MELERRLTDNRPEQPVEWDRFLRFNHFPGLNASGANADTLAPTIHLSLDGLQVHIPAAPGNVVCVGDIVAELRLFATNFT